MSVLSLRDRIADFFDGHPHAVVGASVDRSKFGNKVLRAFMAAGHEVYPVNPRESVVEGLKAYATLDALPEGVHGLSIVTPPEVTEMVVRSAIAVGIKHLWMQPGAVSERAATEARAAGCSVIAGDACVLVEMR